MQYRRKNLFTGAGDERNGGKGNEKEVTYGATPDNSNWGTAWTYFTVSQYETKEQVIKGLCGTLKVYFSAWWGLAEETCGILYTKWLPDTGSWQVWWLS